MTQVKWNKIPKETQDEIKYIQEWTKKTGRESSLTICQKPKSKEVFVSNSAKGDGNSTEALSCDITYGKSSRIADVHTHPVDADTIGILPSPADLTSTLVDSFTEQRPQISCITNHVTPLTECYQPKKVPDKQKIAFYQKGLEMSNEKGDHSWFMDNADKDFNFNFYDPHNGRLIRNPKAKLIVDSALGGSTESLKKNLNELERPGFCLYVKTFTRPRDNKIEVECKRQLKEKRDWLGLPNLDF